MCTTPRLRRSTTFLSGLLALGACADPVEPIVRSRIPSGALAAAAEWDSPNNLGSTINSPMVELQVGVAPNGRSLFVSSARPGTIGQQDLWVSAKQPDVSVDGHYLYFTANRAGGHGGGDCWRSYRADPTDDRGWQTPENLGPNVNTSDNEADCFPFRSGGAEVLWFASLNRPGGQGDWDIYTSRMGPDGVFEPATPVLSLNTPFRETRMTLTGDGHRIFFTSNRPGGLGEIDIWVADRQTPNGPFCTPVNLGAPINSPDNDRSPSITTDGAELY
jgi:hypothetical protein